MVLEHDGAVGAGAVDLAVFQQHAARRYRRQAGDEFSSVDLPQPEWPMMETNSPWSMVEVDVLQHLGDPARRG